jgi:hypothetical protein
MAETLDDAIYGERNYPRSGFSRSVTQACRRTDFRDGGSKPVYAYG